MSLETASGDAKLTWCVHGFTDILEILAFAIHPGSSENTTTLCLLDGKIFMTSQSNLGFEGINAKFLQEKLNVLRGLLLRVDVPLEKRIDAWWRDHCVLSIQVGQEVTKGGVPRSKETIEKADEKIATVWKVIFQPAMQEFFGSQVKEKATLIDDLLKAFSATVVVLNEHIFRKAPSTTGFHGESRILRYLFIRWADAYLVSNSTAKRLREDLDKAVATPPVSTVRNL